MANNSASLSSEKFDDLLRCLSLLKETCNDVDIREGVVRQRTNDNTTVFEIDLSPILDNLTIPMTALKQKLDLFKCFQGNDIEITTKEDNFTISDQYSTIKIMYPTLEFMDNKFMSKEEINSIYTLDENDLILEVDISKTISDRMRSITQGFNVTTVQVLFEEEKAAISAKTQSKDQYAKFLGDITTERVLNSSSNLVVIPFVVDHDNNIQLKMFNYKDNGCINEFRTSISNVDVTIYGRSALVSTE